MQIQTSLYVMLKMSMLLKSLLETKFGQMVLRSISCCCLFSILVLLYLYPDGGQMHCHLFTFFRFVISYAYFFVYCLGYVFSFHLNYVWVKHVPTQHHTKFCEFRLKSTLRSICVVWICLPARTTDLEHYSLLCTFLPQYALCVRITNNKKQTPWQKSN